MYYTCSFLQINLLNMLHKFLYSCVWVIIFLLPLNASAHSFDIDLLQYILSTPEASWSDFSNYVSRSGSIDLQNALQNPVEEVIVALELPGKLYVWNYVDENPDFTQEDIATLIQDDPMLSEIGAERIYTYLKEYTSFIQQQESYYQTPPESSMKKSETSLSSFQSFYRSIVVWLQHILLGYDHILFLFTLIICLPAWKRIIQIITTFTIAHSITILLWGLQIVTLPSLLVESMIVLSIVMMWVYALKNKVWEHKKLSFELWLIFILGLFHGLGFAWFFSDILQTSENIIVPVLWFNIWVEIWQIIIIIILLTLLSWAYTYFPKKSNLIKNILALVSIILWSYWLILKFI